MAKQQKPQPEPIAVAAQRVIDAARVYMRQHGLTNYRMAVICGISELMLRRRGGIMNPNWTCGLVTLGKLERGMRDNPAPNTEPPLPQPARQRKERAA